MSKKRLIQDLEDYQSFNTLEEAHRQLTLQFLKGEDNNFDRSNKEGHVTGSAWVVNKERTHVLLIHHKVKDTWFQPGGHADGESIIQKVAKREAQEETGITKIKPLSPLPFDVDVHLIPHRKDKNEPEHYHYDIRYVFEGDMNEELQMQEDEVKGVQWFAVSEAQKFLEGGGMDRMIAKMKKML